MKIYTVSKYVLEYIHGNSLSNSVSSDKLENLLGVYKHGKIYEAVSFLPKGLINIFLCVIVLNFI